MMRWAQINLWGPIAYALWISLPGWVTDSHWRWQLWLLSWAGAWANRPAARQQELRRWKRP